MLEKTLESPLDSKEVKPVNPKENQPWYSLEGRSDAETEAPILWPPNAKSRLLGKDPDAGKDWGQEEKGATEDEMVAWHHWLNGHEFEQTLGDDEQGSLACCSPWAHKESDMTYWLNNHNISTIAFHLDLSSNLSFLESPSKSLLIIPSRHNFCNTCPYSHKNVFPSLAYCLALPRTKEAPWGQRFHWPCSLSRTSNMSYVLDEHWLCKVLLPPIQTHPSAVASMHHPYLLCLATNDRPTIMTVLRATLGVKHEYGCLSL